VGATEPETELDARFSSPDATPRTWAEARVQLEAAQLYWLSTVHPAGRPRVTPLIAVWVEGALFFTTGPDERKAANLAANGSCVLTTGCNVMGEGLDVVVHGEAVNVRDGSSRRRPSPSARANPSARPATGSEEPRLDRHRDRSTIDGDVGRTRPRCRPRARAVGAPS